MSKRSDKATSSSKTPAPSGTQKVFDRITSPKPSPVEQSSAISMYFVKQVPALDVLMGSNIYEGYMLNDVREGPGRWQWADGQVTLGEWISGECRAVTSELQRRTLHGINGHATRGAAAAASDAIDSPPERRFARNVFK